MNKITVITYLHSNETQFKRCVFGLERQIFKEFDWVILTHQMPNETIAIPHQVMLLPPNMHVKSEVLNWALPQIKTKYIAYNDSDDSSFPNRLQLQFDFMEKNPKVDVCSGMFFVNESENTWPLHENSNMISAYLLINSPMANPVAFFRNKIGVFGKSLVYNPNYIRSQDYDFWIQCLKYGLRFHNIQTQLFSYYVPENKVFHDSQAETADLIRNELLHDNGIIIPVTLHQTYVSFCKLQHVDQDKLFKLLQFLKNLNFKSPFKAAHKAFAWQLDLYMKHHQLSNNEEFKQMKTSLEKQSLLKRLFS
jgi:glycosyltransferase involved in cell wall biosynthesis